MDSKVSKQNNDSTQASVSKKAEEEIPEQFSKEGQLVTEGFQNGTPPPSANNIMNLQRLIGNKAVQRIYNNDSSQNQKPRQKPNLGMLAAPYGFVQRLQRGQPELNTLTINMEHIIQGEVKGGGRIVGFHSIHGKIDRTREVTPRAPDADRNAVYEADVTIGDATKFSTMYPDNWSENDIEAAIAEAYEGATVWDGSYFEGTGNGLRIGGYVNGDKLNTAFPKA